MGVAFAGAAQLKRVSDAPYVSGMLLQGMVVLHGRR